MKTLMSDLARNKANVIAFHERRFNDGKPREAVERYVGPDYIQHNPHVATGTKGCIDYFKRMAHGAWLAGEACRGGR